MYLSYVEVEKLLNNVDKIVDSLNTISESLFNLTQYLEDGKA